MENRRWDNDRQYNERWDEYADRDRYERDYYQNRDKKPQGYSYDSDRDHTGEVDYHRYGTGYTGNDYNRFNENRYGYGDTDRYGSSGATRRYDDRQGRTNYGYSENRNRGYGGGASRNRRADYDYGRGYGSSEWNRPANMGNFERRNYGNYGYREPGYDSNRYGNRNRGDYESYLGRTGGDYDMYGPFRDEERGWWDRTSDEVASWFGDDEAKRRREMDRREDHRGKGVKGYQRSDDKIKSDLEDELYHDSYIDASDMTVSVTNAVVTLAGSVDSKWTKRRAEDLAESVTGVKDVTNNLTIRKDTDPYDNDTRNRGSMTTNTAHKTDNKTAKKSTEV